MESGDDFLPFAPSQEPSSPVPQRKLKRLKKASRVSSDPLLDQSENAASIEAAEFGSLEILNTEENDGRRVEESNSGSGSPLEGFDEESELNYGFSGLDLQEDDRVPEKDADFRSMEKEFDENGEGQRESIEMGEENGDLGTEDSEKKRRHFDEVEEKREKNKKKRAKNSHDDEKLKSGAPSKRKAEKERRDYLNQLRAESQRLLRETSDVGFKPAPLVTKPISSVLEKIRKRKLEISRRSVMLETDFVHDDDTENIEGGNAGYEKADIKEMVGHPDEMENSLNASCADVSKNPVNQSSNENIPSQMALDEEANNTFRPPIDDTQDLTIDSQTSDSQDELPNVSPSSPVEEVLAPSVLVMNLKLDSAPPDDVSSDEDDNDKENIDPRAHGSADMTSSPRGDPVKAFVDDEAEEEDDSDNDLQFQDDEEDENEEDAEGLADMIATECEENTIDNERRNLLHQKWLEQQDAAGTKSLLQRLKCGLEQKEMTLPCEEEDASEDEEGFSDEPEEQFVSKSVVRMNLRKAKEMIPQMFTDKDDVYLSSDDEDAEKSLVKQCLSEKAERKASFLSPADDENSRKVFSLIKKVNVPDIRKKAKVSSFLTMPLVGGNKNITSKSSFLGRVSNHSLSSSHKHGSSSVRSFIFERDDSNSRSTMSMLEDSSDMVQRENHSAKIASGKSGYSHVKSSTQNTEIATENKSGTSLYEILTRSSTRSSSCIQESKVGQTASVFSAFKLKKELIKQETKVSIRNV
ncbi:hypothetical protein HS088_TW12G00599 [Tripterygium wilfordii]|uniref:DNA ligase 1-like n=1 Tax=Tripterygium wilfordii TaxID=458696 RepID=A0A7J7CZ80_TRIWF|nr:DNA ligase 1 [Tripterygium wilfordii]KAF5739394.1 hypothetical protein HS088_TW12G00599 [Tripterygium wilfordii]